MVKEEKMRALDAALGQIEKQFGKGSVMKLGDRGANMQIETTPTGCLSLDLALGLWFVNQTGKQQAGERHTVHDMRVLTT